MLLSSERLQQQHNASDGGDSDVSSGSGSGSA